MYVVCVLVLGGHQARRVSVRPSSGPQPHQVSMEGGEEVRAGQTGAGELGYVRTAQGRLREVESP